MSDLQCAARLFVARHGEAEYESPLLGDFGGCLTTRGRRRARELAEALAPQRIAAVFTSPMARAVQTAEIVAHVLDLATVVTLEGLREFSVGAYAGQPAEPDPFATTFRAWAMGDADARIDGGESGHEVTERMRTALEGIADAYRGESVLVISHGGVMSYVLPQLARNLRGDHALDNALRNCGVVEIDGDADGWSARAWAGESLP